MSMPVVASPRHISLFAFGPVSGLVGCAGRVLDLPDSRCRLPGPEAQWRIDTSCVH